jgi:hypothetical protein
MDATLMENNCNIRTEEILRVTEGLYTVVLPMGIRLKRSLRKLRLCTRESNTKEYTAEWSRVGPDMKWNKGNELNEQEMNRLTEGSEWSRILTVRRIWAYRGNEFQNGVWQYPRTGKAVVTKWRYGWTMGKWSGDIRTGCGGPEIRRSEDSGVRGTDWLQMFGRLDIE